MDTETKDEMTTKLIEALPSVSSKMAEILDAVQGVVVDYAPEVGEALLMITRLEAIDSLVWGGVMMAIAIALFIVTRHSFEWVKNESPSMELGWCP